MAMSSRRVLVVIVLLLLAVGLARQIAFNVLDAGRITYKRPLFTLSELQSKHGHSRDLNHKDTRHLYHRLIHYEIGEWVNTTRDLGADLHELAVGCTQLRWRVRVYTRTRDLEGSFLLDHVLSLRDVFTHALMKKSPTALFDALPCLLMDERLPCPSYASLLATKGNDDAVLRGCFRSNPFYDVVAEVIGEPSREGGATVGLIDAAVEVHEADL
jgi:hypothetical protein